MIDIIFESTPLLFAEVFVIGLIIGSFLNVVILRVPPLLEHDWRCQCQELLQLKPDEDDRPPGIVYARSKCPKCGHRLNLREHFLSDFYIGGFASVNCRAILTRDRGIFRKYFPDLVGYADCLK